MRPSARLVRAVAAERAALERERARLDAEAGDLRAALERIERGMAEIDAQCGLLDRLAPRAASGPAAETRRDAGCAARRSARRPCARSSPTAARRCTTASGSSCSTDEVAGKDPLAVFLTQLSRSPAVRKGARPGVYELDRQAARAPQSRRSTTCTSSSATLTTGTDLATIRARRAQLTAEIGRTEKALEEVARVLAPARGRSPLRSSSRLGECPIEGRVARGRAGARRSRALDAKRGGRDRIQYAA